MHPVGLYVCGILKLTSSRQPFLVFLNGLN